MRDDDQQAGRRDDVDEQGDEASSHHLDDEIAALRADPTVAAALHELDAQGARPLDPEVRTRHLARLRTADTGRPTARRRRALASGRRRRVAVVLVGVLSLSLIAAGGAVAAAQDAAPDDGLYTVKRSSERLWLAVPRSADGAARAELALAERRLDEARRAPAHAEALTAEGIQHAAAAEEERPEDALRAFERLLGDGEGRLPEQASPRARQALHRNCLRLSERLGQEPARCGDAPDGDHPGRGLGRGQQADSDHPGRGLGRGQQADSDYPGRGFGPGGRPEGDTEPRGRGFGPGGRPEGDTEPRGRGFGPGGRPDGDTEPRGRGFGPGGRPDGAVGPPPGVRPLPTDP
jgi:hypothetical protein